MIARALGTIDFSYDFPHDLVLARPRWTLQTAAEAMRWYESHTRYFGARFSRPKDLITVHDAFEVAPQVRALWQDYQARLHQNLVRFAASVTESDAARLSRKPGLAGDGPATIVTDTVADAVAAILARRQAAEHSLHPGTFPATRASSTRLVAQDPDTNPPRK